ncbi:hypothetical protein Mapa_017643 [Marchantia paleacea]|nr:hypothetical protein Mapa_017643 [Marchantia paleacea]
MLRSCDLSPYKHLELNHLAYNDKIPEISKSPTQEQVLKKFLSTQFVYYTNVN